MKVKCGILISVGTVFAIMIMLCVSSSALIVKDTYITDIQNQISNITTNQDTIAAQQQEINKKIKDLDARLNEKWTDKEYVDKRIDELGSMIDVLDDMCGTAQKNYD